MGTAEPVGVLQNTLLSDLDEELVAAEGADVFVQMSGGNALLSVVLKRDGNTVQTMKNLLMTSLTRLGDFLKFLMTRLLSKVAQMNVQFLG